MLDGKCIFIPGHDNSVAQSEQALKSFENYEGWNIRARAGLTPKTMREPRKMFWVEDGRMAGHESRIERYPDEEARWSHMLMTKKSCALNHIRHWQEIVKTGKTMAFFEHDAVCYGDWTNPEFEDVLVLNMQHVFDDPSPLARFWRHTPKNMEPGVHEFAKSYPIRYTYDNVYRGAMLIPGTAAYVMTPQGAEKMLAGVMKYGLDQSDYMINSKLVKLEYLFPSVVKFNDVNLKTSHGDGTRLP